MSISENKIELVKLLLETEDLYILDQIKNIFENRVLVRFTRKNQRRH
jgi:hypothetical protein